MLTVHNTAPIATVSSIGSVSVCMCLRRRQQQQMVSCASSGLAVMSPSSCSVAPRRTCRRRSDGDLCAAVMSHTPPPPQQTQHHAAVTGKTSTTCVCNNGGVVSPTMNANPQQQQPLTRPIQIANCDSTVAEEGLTHGDGDGGDFLTITGEVVTACCDDSEDDRAAKRCRRLVRNSPDNVEPDSTTSSTSTVTALTVEEDTSASAAARVAVVGCSDSGCCSADGGESPTPPLPPPPPPRLDLLLLDSPPTVEPTGDEEPSTPPEQPCSTITLRFPPPSSPSSSQSSLSAGDSAQPSSSSSSLAAEHHTCEWFECGVRHRSAAELLAHLLEVHVQSQRPSPPSSSLHPRQVRGQDKGGEEEPELCRPRCLWRGCKVYGRCGSLNWLRRHAAHAHTGRRPYGCIVSGCQQRFSTQLMLERHVNSHFTTSSPQKRQPDAAAASSKQDRQARKNRRSLLQQHQQHPYSARIFDFCDASVMQSVQHRLLTASPDCAPSARLLLHAQILARRVDTRTSCAEVLVFWPPANSLDARWVPLAQLRASNIQDGGGGGDAQCPAQPHR